MNQAEHSAEKSASHFIRAIIENDLNNQKHSSIVTRFPPEPNGYLHIGHAKSICLNFGLAQDFGGVCHLRMDDTNPEKESDEYVNSIQESVRWLGFIWDGEVRYASDYFQQLYDFACDLIRAGLAYVDDLSAEEIREYRGTLKEAGKNSPYRDRSPEENLNLFEQMKAGAFPDGSKTLRLKIDMASGNINMRDPVIYRIRRAHHHRTGDAWCIYPMYDYTHGISDAIEGITHSLCTLEFEAHRPLYDWILDKLPFAQKPRQYEFSRLELLYSITSKRKLNTLVVEKHVDGWDDPRMPTIAGMRRRGYSPAGLRLFAQRIGISKSENIVEFEVLEGAIRETLENEAPRVMAVLSPLKVTIENFDELTELSKNAPFHPNIPEMGERSLTLSREIWIERDDFAQNPPPKWQRLTVGGEVRLRHSYILRCEEAIYNDAGELIELKGRVDPETLGKNPVGRKVKGVIHWLAADTAVAAEVRLYDRLFTVPRPDAVRGNDGEYVDFRQFLNPESLQTVQAWVEPTVLAALPETRFQFERLGYFVCDRDLHQTGTRVIMNRTVALRDTWAK